jgi:hypothetical protein
MEYKIKNIDCKNYVYVCDILQTDVIFAICRKEYRRFRDFHIQYTFDLLGFMPDDNTVEVYKLYQSPYGFYELLDLNPLQYPAKKIYIIFPKQYSSSENLLNY